MNTESLSMRQETILRIDDISLNLQEDRIEAFLKRIREKYPFLIVVLAVSPGVFDMPSRDNGHSHVSERVFPSILNAHSDHKVFYQIERIGVPSWLERLKSTYDCQVASHGLIHVDHRLLAIDAQEMSIVTSLSLVQSRIFVPPFNKYNKDTEIVCQNHNVDLIKWEDGWNHLGYQPFADDGKNYYVHLHDYPGEKLFSLI